MPRLLSIALAVSALGRVPREYVQPTLAEPHATVTVRVIHHEAPSPHLEFVMRVGELRVPIGPIDRRTVGVPTTRSLRVRPEPALVQFASRYTHTQTYTQTVMRSPEISAQSHLRLSMHARAHRVEHRGWRSDQTYF